MAAELILQFRGRDPRGVPQRQQGMGHRSRVGGGRLAHGMVAHSAGVNEDGHLVVIEVWDTPEHQAAFMEGRLADAVPAKGGITGPPSGITWIQPEAHHHIGS